MCLACLTVVAVSATSAKVHSRSSQLSKNLLEVLHDKDALAYFISYLQSLNVDSLVRFWLDVEAFRLAAERTRSSEAFQLAADRPRADEAVRLAVHPTPPAAASEDSTARSKTPEGTQTQQRVPTNYCGHASSSASSSPKAAGRLPAHGEVVVVSTDAAVPSSSAIPSRPPVDRCPASNPSTAPVDPDSQLSSEVLNSSDGGEAVQAESMSISSVSGDVMTEPPHKGYTYITYAY